VGFGRAGRRRLQAIGGRTERIAYVCDTAVEGLAGLPEGVGRAVKCGKGATGVVTETGAEVVFVCTPPALHEELAVAAIEAGARHVLVEKPLACTAGAAVRLSRLAAERGVHLKVGSNLRCFPEVERLVKLVQDGHVGKVRSARFSIGHDGSSLAPWALDPGIAGGGTLLDNGVHVLDLALWMGLVPREYALRARVDWARPGIDRRASWEIVGEDLSCEFESSWTRNDGSYCTVEVCGECGEARLVVARSASTLELDVGGTKVGETWSEPSDSWGEDTRHFLASAASGGTAQAFSENDGRNGAAVLALVEKVYLAAAAREQIHGQL